MKLTRGYISPVAAPPQSLMFTTALMRERRHEHHTTGHNSMSTTIERRTIPERERPNALPRHFGVRFMMVAETAIFNTMHILCDDYTGGFWEFFDLDNGGFYMAPRGPAQKKVRIEVDTNGYGGEMSLDAAGIVACLMAFSHLSFQYDGKTDAFAEHYHWLREFAVDHAEAGAIFAAID
jgi:hypothetical protein